MTAAPTQRSDQTPGRTPAEGTRKGRSGLSQEEIRQRLREVGYELLEPYQHSHTPVEVRRIACGHRARSLVYTLTRIGLSCRTCQPGGPARPTRAGGLSPEEAIEYVAAFGWDPEAAYSGSVSKTWPLRHRACRTASDISLVGFDGHCSTCAEIITAAPSSTTSRRVAKLLHNLGYTREQPYPGAASEPWHVRHTSCGHIITTTLNQLIAGAQCPLCARHVRPQAVQNRSTRPWPTSQKLSLSPEAAEELLLLFGYEPADDPYPGTVTRKWRVRHVACGYVSARSFDTVRSLHLNNRDRRVRGIKQSGTRCPGCRALKVPSPAAPAPVPSRSGPPRLDQAVVAERLRDAGYEILDPYQRSHVPVRVRHHACGHIDKAAIHYFTTGRRRCAGCALKASNPDHAPAPRTTTVDGEPGHHDEQVQDHDHPAAEPGQRKGAL
ncbi:hypothetical protein AB0E96_00275 [Kitasatospora sp. NPDC036755]|uniref:hypothetical protein n=1 Tax=Kitasatospora sp. NPDC036755 TaxID=3154600 RepID=UPI0033DF6EF4